MTSQVIRATAASEGTTKKKIISWGIQQQTCRGESMDRYAQHRARINGTFYAVVLGMALIAALVVIAGYVRAQEEENGERQSHRFRSRRFVEAITEKSAILLVVGGGVIFGVLGFLFRSQSTMEHSGDKSKSSRNVSFAHTPQRTLFPMPTNMIQRGDPPRSVAALPSQAPSHNSGDAAAVPPELQTSSLSEASDFQILLGEFGGAFE